MLLSCDPAEGSVSAFIRLRPAVVRLEYAYGHFEVRRVGGGVFISQNGDILTTFEFLNNWSQDTPIIARTWDGTSFHVVNVRADKKMGLALLRPQNPSEAYDYVDFSFGIDSGTGYHHIGCPSGMEFTYASVVIRLSDRRPRAVWSSIRHLESWNREFFEAGLPSKKTLENRLIQCCGIWGCANSGSPLLDGNGKLVGLYFFHWGRSDYAIRLPDIDRLNAFINGARDDSKGGQFRQDKGKRVQGYSGWKDHGLKH